MNPALRKKYFAESWLMWSVIAIGVVLFCWFRVWIVGELDTAQFRQIIDLLPKDWRKFSPVDFDWLVSYLGRTSLTLDEPMLIMLIVGWSMVRGSDVVSGELGRGTMEMLVAQPISRRAIYWEHAVWTFIGLALLVLLAWFGMSLGIWTTSVEETTYPEIRIPWLETAIPLRFLEPVKETIAMSSEVNPVSFLPGIVDLLCLGFFFGGFSAFCSAVDRYRWRTLGIVFGFYFANAGLKILAVSSERLNWLEYMTIFEFYSPAKAIEAAQYNAWTVLWLFEWSAEGQIDGAGNLLNCLVLLGLGTVCYWAGGRVFYRRDLPAPV